MSGCQLPDHVFAEALVQDRSYKKLYRAGYVDYEKEDVCAGSCLRLKGLDVSYSSIRDGTMQTLASSAKFQGIRESLKVLDVSGLYRFRRNSVDVLAEVVRQCEKLEKLVLRDCPDVTGEDVEFFNTLIEPGRKWQVVV